MVALPAGSDGANEIPLKLESDGAVSSSANEVPELVAVVRVSVIPYRNVGSRSAIVALVT